MTPTPHPGQAFRERLADMGMQGAHFRRAVQRLSEDRGAPVPQSMSEWLSGGRPAPYYAWALLSALEMLPKRKRAKLARRG